MPRMTLTLTKKIILPKVINEAATHITISMFIIIFFNTALSCSRVFKLKATFDAKQRYEIKDLGFRI